MCRCCQYIDGQAICKPLNALCTACIFGDEKMYMLAKRRKLYEAGLSNARIAERCGVSRSAIVSWLGRRGLASDEQREKHKKKSRHTLCWMCENTNAEKCSWFDPQRQRPVKGWTAEKTVVLYSTPQGVKSFESYCVISCPNYKPSRKGKA